MVEGPHDLAPFQLDVGAGVEVDDVGAELVVEPGGHVEVGGDQRTHVVRLEVEPVGDLDALTGRQVDPFDGHRCVGTLDGDHRRRLAFADGELLDLPDVWKLPNAG